MFSALSLIVWGQDFRWILCTDFTWSGKVKGGMLSLSLRNVIIPRSISHVHHRSADRVLSIDLFSLALWAPLEDGGLSMILLFGSDHNMNNWAWCCHSLICLSSKYFFCCYHVLGAVLGSGSKAVKWTDWPS